MQLAPDASWILRKAWSIRLIILAGLLTGIETILPFVPEYLGISTQVYSAITFSITAAAFIARIVAQNQDEEDEEK